METITQAIDAINDGRDVPKKIGDFKLKWISTDAWRGYYDATATKKSGWIKAGSNWLTGNWGDAPSGHSSGEVETTLEEMEKQAHLEGKEMAVIYLPTSNVFSTAYDVFLRVKK